MATGWARIACYLAPDDPMSPWYREAIEHAGLRVERLDNWTPSELSRCHVLLLCGRGSVTSIQAEAIGSWVESGGSLVVSGGSWGLEALMGHEPGGARHRSVGYLVPSQPDRFWPEAPRAKFFGGITVKVNGGQIIGTVDGEPMLTRHRFGKGHCLFTGFHLGQTFQQMVLGHSVEVDGIGAADGSAQLDDGVLRSEDGTNLSFEDDRTTVEGGLAPFFGEAHADILREIWLRSVFEGIDRSEHSAAVLWTWPNNANAVASLVLDVHDFEVDRVIALQRILQMFGCPAAWMVAMPGYAADVYRALRAMEHEVGLLFHIEEPNGWHDERLKIQLTNLSRLASWPYMSSVRIEDGQWRGWSQFYDACESAGARVSLNKGGRQPGTAGFLFGTCHPFFPIRPCGRESLVCELPGQVWEPGIVTSEQVGAELVERVLERSGHLQLGMRPESLSDAHAAMALRRILSVCKERHVLFSKPDDIFRFERARRQMKMSFKHVGDADLLQLASETEVSGLTILVSGEPRRARDRHGDIGAFPVQRYGTTFSAVQVDVPSRMLTDLEWTAVGVASHAA